ncbi:MAG: VOC family protein [Proteobacteria bacterium]|nr:VOC family protein [Pseudomonadota bacterium]
MTRVHHVALWTEDLDRLKHFYVTYFGASAGPRYANPAKGFESIFLGFGDGARLELMRSTTVPTTRPSPGTQPFGLTHLALEVGARADVDALAARLAAAGHPIVDGPRQTGDGYYEAVSFDPDGNRLELCATPAPAHHPHEES